MANNLEGLVLVLSLFWACVIAVEQGRWQFSLNQDNAYAMVHKTMYNNTPVSVKVDCSSNVKIRVQWKLRYLPCYISAAEGGDSQEQNSNNFYNMDHSPLVEFENTLGQIRVQTSTGNNTGDCGQLTLKDESGAPINVIRFTTTNITEKASDSSDKSVGSEAGKAGKVKRQATPPLNVTKTKAVTTAAVTVAGPQPVEQSTKGQTNKPMPAGNKEDTSYVARAWQDGTYVFMIKVSSEEKFDVSVDISIENAHGYLSAVDWPLIIFYGVMCIIYVLYGLLWLIMSFCNWKDLLRIQFWIGAVIFLGMLEKAVFYAEYQSINSTGKSVRGAIIVAELVSCMKRALARMLVVIVSLGFGIVKPRLGPMLHRVLGMGALYFILGSVEGCLRVLNPREDPKNHAALAKIPLVVLDAAIAFWVFSSLVQTTRTLRLRRNVVKLSLYRHFTNTLIFAVVASVAFMIWSIKQHTFAECLQDWAELWLDDAYWHLLFSVILMVIMVLWRPTINNQRYAFSPLLDAADQEAEEPMMNDAFEGMKMRGLKAEGQVKPKEPASKVEDDLKWIEENIPASVADTALPSLLDSDEEIMTTKFEMSKME
ncbi:transmembrane protein 87A isoform X2 [Lingula anatina]|uniref:Transmembrane protein 87A isoform X2 n=2 Tax=Lingula anatina TaxID=7574 RepID=A0A1S3H6B4_LINAN|nr:transmembrane protein 87A isoform X2 [Lingula anatina]|eukprot:XP_013381527.1 transmembrane protein 87A isoform X2 [Lingula anatina]